MTHPCPTCFHPIKLTYHQRRSMARGHQPRCPICNPRPPKCAVCNGPHRKSEHVFGDSKSACPLCAWLAHRVVGPRCRGCRLLYADEAPVELEDPMRSHMGRVSDLGGTS